MNGVPSFHSDRPAILSSDNDHFRYLPVARSIYEILANWYSLEAPEPLVLGIFGGFGQGKSTLLESVREPLRNGEWRNVSELRTNGLSIEIIAVEGWHYQAGDIQGHFNQVMTRETWVNQSSTIRKIGFAAFLDLVASLKKPFAGESLKQDNSERATADVPLYQPASSVLRKGVSKAWGVLNSDVKVLAESLAQVLREKEKRILFWIDDLDRTSVEVQIALLKQIFAYRERIGIPIVVAIDPTALLRGETASENQDLLRKAFTATLQLPGKRPERFVEYAESLSENLFGRFGRATVSQIGNLISYTTSGNPRLVKRFLNSLALLTHRISCGCRRELTSAEVLALARWQLAQIRWPLVFGSRGEEELLHSMLRRRVLGEVSENSFQNFFGSLSDDPQLSGQAQEVVHFLRQTRNLAVTAELTTTQWLCGAPDLDGFDWGAFWDQVECGNPDEAIELLRRSDFPHDFQSHFQARTARWIHRRCFSEAAAILDTYWRLVYEQQERIEQLQILVDQVKSAAFSFVMRSVAHMEVAAAWRHSCTWPTLISLLRLQNRLPNDWAMLYMESVFKIDGDMDCIKQWLLYLAAQNALTDETLRRLAVLLTSWLLEHWQNDTQELGEFLFRDLPQYHPTLISRVIMRLQSTISTDHPDDFPAFTRQSLLLAWLIEKSCESSILSSIIPYTTWFVTLENRVRSVASIEDSSRSDILCCCRQMLGHLFGSFLDVTVTAAPVHALFQTLAQNVSWRLIQQRLCVNELFDEDSNRTDATNGNIFVRGMCLRNRQNEPELQKFCNQLVGAIQSSATEHMVTHLEGLACCVARSTSATIRFNYVKLLLQNSLQSNLPAVRFGRAWAALIHVAIEDKNHLALNTAAEFLQIPEYLEIAVHETAGLQKFSQFWVLHLHVKSDLHANFISAVKEIGNAQLLVRVGYTLARCALPERIEFLRTIQADLETESRFHWLLALRQGILEAKDVEAWRMLPVSENGDLLLSRFDNFLLNANGKTPFANCIREHQHDDTFTQRLESLFDYSRKYLSTCKDPDTTILRIRQLSRIRSISSEELKDWLRRFGQFV